MYPIAISHNSVLTTPQTVNPAMRATVEKASQSIQQGLAHTMPRTTGLGLKALLDKRKHRGVTKRQFFSECRPYIMRLGKHRTTPEERVARMQKEALYPNPRSLFRDPDELSERNELQQILLRTLGLSPLQNNSSSFAYTTTNDFGRRIIKLLISPPVTDSPNFFSNIIDISKHEGFQLTPSKDFYYVRDPKLPTANGSVLKPIDNMDFVFRRSFARMQLRMHHLRDHASDLSKHPLFQAILGTVGVSGWGRYAHEGLAGGVIKPSRLYFEGGNCFYITNQKQKPHYVIGQDLLTMTHLMLRESKWFNAPDLSQRTAARLAENGYLKSGDFLNMLYRNGQVPREIETIAQEIEGRLSDDQILGVLSEVAVMQEAAAVKLLDTVKFDSTADKTEGRRFAAHYLAQREFVQNVVFPKELSCQSADITFIPQAAYHLDLFMMPGPKGSIFLQDHALTSKILEQIAVNSGVFWLTLEELEEVILFQQTSDTISKDLAPLFSQIKTKLEQAGFLIIPTPGVFYGYALGINFLNSITGFSPQTGHPYCITYGAQTDGKVGQIFMNFYEQFLKMHHPNIEVYFIGRNPNDSQDFSEAMRNSNETQSGPHCMSYELEIEPHVEQ